MPDEQARLGVEVEREQGAAAAGALDHLHLAVVDDGGQAGAPLAGHLGNPGQKASSASMRNPSRSAPARPSTGTGRCGAASQPARPSKALVLSLPASRTMVVRRLGACAKSSSGRGSLSGPYPALVPVAVKLVSAAARAAPPTAVRYLPNTASAVGAEGACSMTSRGSSGGGAP